MLELSPLSLFDWFKKNRGTIDSESIAFTTFQESEGGRGVIALRDIPKDHVLFTIPRFLTLSTRTSTLPSRFGLETWKNMQLNQGWTGLILCMMWENASGPSSIWSEYFAILPNRFETPMFWNEDDLRELDGTSVVEKLGREEAEHAYEAKLLPALQSRPDLFPPDKAEYYSLANYHLMGSRILSRSFNVERWESAEEEEGDSNANSRSNGMDVDSPDGPEDVGKNDEDPHQDEAEEEDEEDDSSDTAMVPMADMLNARYGSENAKLFSDENELRMVSTKPIKAGEQIWNTYGDLPNAELLRRYGHVDLLPLPRGKLGNPGDVVELRADIAVTTAAEKHLYLSSESLRERIDWWLEEGGDDVFVLESDLELPELFISLVRLLLFDQAEWEAAKAKGKPPKPRLDIKILSIVQTVLEKRLKVYPTTLLEDEQMLTAQLTANKRRAIIVRMGEKQILTDLLGTICDLQNKHSEKSSNKRKGGIDGESKPQKRLRK